MDRIVAGQQGARVLSVLVQKDGTATVQLYDQTARVTDAEEVSCSECGAEALALKVKDVVSELLARCAGTRCADAVLSGAVQAPLAACQPYPSDVCTSPALDALLAPRSPTAFSGSLDPKTARIIKGLVWGGFAVTAATGITLLALSGTSAGIYQLPSGGSTKGNLDGPGWATLGVSGALLGISIPITLLLDRAASNNVQHTSAATGSALIQCPN
jgi:hypothetical protein